ncbi:leader peptidase (prepilin peptidase)/N-methyltransferase [Streptacidiphilus sp. MAP12-20]|uniref:prepilin peptidase n=1 Tax=Streptacidiphilus sp. MAP12-20 TaxID=3156299 RepID=UPI00351267B6
MSDATPAPYGPGAPVSEAGEDGETYEVAAEAEPVGRPLRIFPRPDAETRGVLRADALPIALGAAAVIVALAFHDGWSLLLPAHAAFAVFAAALTVLDARLRRLPDALTYPAYPALLLLLCLPGDGGPLFRAVLGALALALGYYVLALFGGAGLGDVKASGLVGLVLGYLGWRTILTGTVYAALLAGVWAIVLLATRRAGRRSQLAFGPFLMTGAVLAILV